MAIASLRVYKTLPAPVRILVFGTMLMNLGTMIGPFLTVVMVQMFHLTPIRAGKVVSAFMGGTLISVIAGGWLTDRIGRRRTLLLSLFGAGSMALILGCVSEAKIFLPTLFLFGFLTDLYRPASSTLLADHLTSRQRSSGYAAIRVAMNLGAGVAVALGGLFMDLNWRLLFWFDGITTLAFGVLTYLYIHDVRRNEQTPMPFDPKFDVPPWRSPPFMLYAVVTACLGIVFNSHFTILPLTITQAAGYSNKVLGLLLGLNGLVITLFEIGWVDRLSSRRRLRVAAVGTLLIAVGMGITGVWLHWSWLVMTILMWTAGEILAFSFLLSFITDLSPPHRRGQYLSFNQACWRGFMSLSPLLLLPLYSRFSVQTFWLLLGLMCLPATAMILYMDRKYDRPEKWAGAG